LAGSSRFRARRWWWFRNAKLSQQRAGLIDLAQSFGDSLRGDVHRARLLIGVEKRVGKAFEIAVEGHADQLARPVHHRTAVIAAADIAGGNEIERRHFIERASSVIRLCGRAARVQPSLRNQVRTVVVRAIVQPAERIGVGHRNARAIGIPLRHSELHARRAGCIRIFRRAEQLESILRDFLGRRGLERSDQLVMLLAEPRRVLFDEQRHANHGIVRLAGVIVGFASGNAAHRQPLPLSGILQPSRFHQRICCILRRFASEKLLHRRIPLAQSPQLFEILRQQQRFHRVVNRARVGRFAAN